MRFGFILPGGSAPEQLEQALLAEEHGWDGVFVWEAAYGVDAWTLLGAMAARTERVRLGTMLTPLPWRRPWKVASQLVTLDQLSGGRAVVTVGLGAVDTFLGNTGEELDRRRRADLLDEGIDVMARLWRGELTYHGRRHSVDLSRRTDLATTARPVQEELPLWVVGAWPRPKSMRRVLRCAGLVPTVMEQGRHRPPTPEDIRAMRAWLEERGGAGPGFDVVMEGSTPADDPAAARATVTRWAEAGCTWWLEARWEAPEAEGVRARLAAGPPRVDR